MIMWGIPNVIDAINRVRIDQQYTIEYIESRNTKCLYNGAQILVCDPKLAYWNNDTLLVSDGYDCYLFELGRITYKDEIEEIPCENLKNGLWQQPVEVWRAD